MTNNPAPKTVCLDFDGVAVRDVPQVRAHLGFCPSRRKRVMPAWDAAFGSVSRIARAVGKMVKSTPETIQFAAEHWPVTLYMHGGWKQNDAHLGFEGHALTSYHWPLSDLRAALKEVKP